MRRIVYIFLIYFALFAGNKLSAQSSTVSKASVSASDTFPTPPSAKNRLFYVQRTHNKNTIIYDVNYNADSTINETEPVKVYWIRYSDKGEITPLSFIQKKYAYGVEATLIDANKKVFKVNFVSYKKRDIYLMKSRTDNTYRAFINVNGKLCYLTHVFVQIEGGTFWLPHIKHVEISGTDISSGQAVRETFKP